MGKIDFFMAKLENELYERYQLCDATATPDNILLAVLNALSESRKKTIEIYSMEITAAIIENILNKIEINKTAWERGEDIVVLNGIPIGATVGKQSFEFDRWWPNVISYLSEILYKELINKKK